MIPEYCQKSRALSVDGQTFSIESRKRVKGYEFFQLEDGRRIITNGSIFFFTPTSSYGARQLTLYENRPPLHREITAESEILSLEDGIAIYYGITGACTVGLEMFVKSLTVPPFPMPIKLLVRLTRGKYGSDILAEYLNPTGKRLFFGSQHKNGSIVPIQEEKPVSIEDELNIAAKPTGSGRRAQEQNRRLTWTN